MNIVACPIEATCDTKVSTSLNGGGAAALVGSRTAALRLARTVLPDVSETSAHSDPKAAVHRAQLARMYSLKACGTRFKEPEIERAFKLSQAKANCQVKLAPGLSRSFLL